MRGRDARVTVRPATGGRPCVPLVGHGAGGDPLNRDEKAQAIEELTERLRASATVIAADFQGLSVQDLGTLRGDLRPLDAQFEIVKNTLAKRAAAEAGREDLVPLLQGPTALVWIDGDPALAAKALTTFAGAHDERPALKGGLLEGAALPADSIIALTKLPPREQLVAQLVGGLASPIQRLSAVAAPLQQLGGGLNALIGGLGRALAGVRDARAAAGE